MAVRTYSLRTQGNLQLSPNFTVREFRCRCNRHDDVRICDDLVRFLQAIRTALGVPVTISSGHRCAAHNRAVGGASGSFHLQGRAADFTAVGRTPEQVAIAAERVGAPGIIRYTGNRNFVHIDTRPNRYWATDHNGRVTVVRTFGGGTSGGGEPVSRERIREIQRRMNTLYNAGLVVDGIFGPLTRRALIRGFQTEINRETGAGIAADGIWGPITQANSLLLRQGGRGNAVFILQGILYCRGFTQVGFDGIFGPITAAEVRRFQGANGLVVDGIAGPLTFGRLFA
ncbi:MAG: D-Ala-D-Ala carboxypeptidase family metallohydrolase [Oscillospiraceae bacterium]|nr:D-Ala-D-Ala carboxypeptidase family metallohydrolase [Oscillospiraceae bacterium]